MYNFRVFRRKYIWCPHTGDSSPSFPLAQTRSPPPPSVKILSGPSSLRCGQPRGRKRRGRRRKAAKGGRGGRKGDELQGAKIILKRGRHRSGIHSRRFWKRRAKKRTLINIVQGQQTRTVLQRQHKVPIGRSSIWRLFRQCSKFRLVL